MDLLDGTFIDIIGRTHLCGWEVCLLCSLSKTLTLMPMLAAMPTGALAALSLALHNCIGTTALIPRVRAVSFQPQPQDFHRETSLTFSQLLVCEVDSVALVLGLKALFSGIYKCHEVFEISSV